MNITSKIYKTKLSESLGHLWDTYGTFYGKIYAILVL
mgnify:FL=1